MLWDLALGLNARFRATKSVDAARWAVAYSGWRKFHRSYPLRSLRPLASRPPAIRHLAPVR